MKPKVNNLDPSIRSAVKILNENLKKTHQETVKHQTPAVQADPVENIGQVELFPPTFAKRLFSR